MTEKAKPSGVTIPCFVLPMQDMQLILPNVAVAEVIAWMPPVPVENVPAWYLGHVDWRGETVPIISYERLNESPLDSHSKKVRMVIFNSSGAFPGLDFFGMIIQSIPHLLRVEHALISELSEVEKVSSVQMVVNTAQGTSIIPDLAYIEKCVHDVQSAL